MPSKPNRSILRVAGIAVALASLGAFASAYAAPGKRIRAPRPTTKGTCRKPTKTQCLDPKYLRSSCGKKHKMTCAPFARTSIKDAIDAMPGKKIPMLKPRGSKIPGDIRMGKTKAYGGPSPFFRMISTGTNVFAESGLTNAPKEVSASVAKKAHRNPAWDSNGQKIKGCKEYAYEQLYDYMRFVDAAAACRGSKQCVFDVAYLPGVPGISERTLKRRDGKALPLKMQIRVPSGLKAGIPKNVMFSNADRFVYSGPGGSLPQSKDLDKLAAELRAGKKEYKFNCTGSTCAKNQYKSEWGWHAEMESKLSKLPRAHLEEYKRRREQFMDLLQAWGQAVGAEKEAALGGKLPPVTAHQWVNPLDTLTNDPFEQLSILTGYSKTANTTFMKLKQVLPQSKLKQINELGGGLRARGLVGMNESAVAPLGVFAAPSVSGTAPAPIDANFALKNALRKCDLAKYKVIAETAGVGPLSCKVGAFLRHEWKRKADSNDTSCLDRSRPDCDWSLEIFENRVLRSLPNIDSLQDHEELCRLVEPSGNLSPEQPNVAAAQKYFEDVYEDITKALRELTAYDKGKGSGKAGRKLAGGWDDEDYFGDKKWFALGYEYDLGWSVEPTKRNKSTEMCELGGDAHANLGVNSWVLKKQVPLVDAELRTDVNKGGSGVNDLHAHVKVFDIDLFDPVDASFSHAWNQPLATWAKNIPEPRPSFNVNVGIPITGAAWGELGAGVLAKAKIKVNSECVDPKSMQFGIDGSLTPTFFANGLAQVGIGVSGVASAGVRGLLNLVTVGVPLDVGLGLGLENYDGGAQQVTLDFSAQIGLTLATLSGYLALYVEVVGADAEHVLFRWNGLGPKRIELMKPLTVEVPITGL